jgi:hypothetical protein
MIDALLAGPHGALILKVDGSDGRLRCLGDKWYVWDKKLKDFAEAATNLTQELKQGLNLVESVLTSHNLINTVPVQGAIVFVNSKLQLEHMEPDVPLIQADAIKSLAAELAGSPMHLEKRDVEKVLAAFGAKAEVSAVAAQPAAASPPEEAHPAPRKKRGPLGLTRQQLVAVIAMGIVCLIVMAVCIYVVAARPF